MFLHYECLDIVCNQYYLVCYLQFWKLEFSQCLQNVYLIYFTTYSSLYNLDPYIYDCGLLVVGGRLRHSGLQLSAKHPCILPYRHPVSTLVTRSVHDRCHLGREWVLSQKVLLDHQSEIIGVQDL